MKAQTTPATQNQPSSADYDAIRRSLRRHLFVIEWPDFNLNTAALRTDFGMHLDYLAAARFTCDRAVPETGKYHSSTELLLIKPLERLMVSVNVYAPKAGAAPQTFETRLVHSANPIGENTHHETSEYETTNVYQVGGVLTVEALELFWSEHDGLKKHAQTHLPESDEFSPFSHWQFSRLEG